MANRTVPRVLACWFVLALAVTLAWPKEAIRMTGAELYANYCASCHGPKGEGDGPDKAKSKRPPSDLTRMAERNGGKFSRERVVAVLSDPEAYVVTGMPSGRFFFSGLGDSPVKQKMIYRRLADFIETLQKPAEPPPPPASPGKDEESPPRRP